MASSWESEKVDNSRMRLYVSLPETDRPAPGIIVIQGQSGVEDFLEVTRMIAHEGFVAAAPDLFHRDPPQCNDEGPKRRARLRDELIIRDVNAAVSFLKSHRRVVPEYLGIVGFCMGGRVVYLTSAAISELKAGVMYYGGDTMRPWGTGPSPFERTAEIHCPILGHFGEKDQNPSPADMQKLDTELTRLGKIHEFYAYPAAGHAFANLGSAKYVEQAAAASWSRTFEFFARHLKQAAI